jgi:MFS family permease
MAANPLWRQKQNALVSGAVTPKADNFRDPLWTNAFLKIWAFNFLICVWFFIINVIFPFYIKHLGGTEMTVGLAAGGFALAAILIRPAAGWFLDHRSRSALIKVGVVGLAAISVLYLVTPVLSLVLALRLLSGLVFAGAGTAGNTNACDIIPQSRFGEGMGFLGLGNTLASALGPVLGLILMAHYGFKAAFAVSAFLVLLAIIAVRGLPYKTMQPLAWRQRRKLPVLLNASALPASVVMLFAGVPFGGISVFIALYGVFSGLGDGGWFFLLVAIGTGSTRLFSGRLADKKGEQPMVVLGNSSFFLALILLLWESSACYYISGLLFGFGFGLLAPAMQAMAVRIVPLTERGSASSTFLCSSDIGSGLGGLIAGWLITIWGYRPMFAALSIFVIIAALVYVLWAAKTPSAFKVFQQAKRAAEGS